MLTAYNQGKVKYDDLIHAGAGVPPAAVCEAGLLVTRIAGRFDTDDRRACPRCASLVKQTR